MGQHNNRQRETQLGLIRHNESGSKTKANKERKAD